MKGNLYLTSGGFIDGQYDEKMGEIFQNVCSNKKVLLIDNATITGSNTKGPANIIKNFNNIGASVDRITLDSDNLDVIFGYDVVYVTGGDCAPLAYLAMDEDVSKTFTKYLNEGGIVFGESAGSIFFGKDFKWYYDVKKGTKPKYDVELPSWSGLGLVDIKLYPHYNKADDNQKGKIKNYCKDNNCEILCMKDDDFLIIDNLFINSNKR